jgi:hypothetical protein
MRRVWLAGLLTVAFAISVVAQGPDASPKQAPAPTKQAPAPTKQAPAAPAPAAPVKIRTSVSRTAVWVGDPVTYVVEVECPPKVDILADDLAAERLQLKGLDLLSVEVERDASVPERVTHRMRYRLAAFEPEAALGVAAIPVRYYIRQPGMRPEDAVPAGEVVVPPLVLSLRSTIPDAGTAALRDTRAVQPPPPWVRFAKPVGLTLVLLAFLPVTLWIVDLVRRAQQRRGHAVRRQTRKQRLAALEQIKELDVSSAGALREAYAQLDAWVRTGLQQTTGVPAPALTPAEIDAAVRHPPRAVRMEQVQSVLRECERAKYAPHPPSADQWQTVLLEAEQAIGAAR